MKEIKEFAHLFSTELYDMGYADVIRNSGLECATNYISARISIAYIVGYATCAESANGLLKEKWSFSNASITKYNNALRTAVKMKALFGDLGTYMAVNKTEEFINRECDIMRQTLLDELEFQSM